MTTQTQTPQQRMKAELAKSGIPYKRIEVYGAQIVITAWSEDAARKWWSLINHFATMRGSVLHSHEDTIDEVRTTRRILAFCAMA